MHKLNERIEYLLDRDHLIGHSYFMNVSNWNDLCQIFHQNIIPTLQDYFFNDWKKVAMVLGDTSGFKKTENENFIIPKNKKYSDLFLDDDDNEDNIQYEINPILISGNYNNFPLEAIQKSFIVNE